MLLKKKNHTDTIIIISDFPQSTVKKNLFQLNGM